MSGDLPEPAELEAINSAESRLTEQVGRKRIGELTASEYGGGESVLCFDVTRATRLLRLAAPLLRVPCKTSGDLL
jgi:hypothetical protein